MHVYISSGGGIIVRRMTLQVSRLWGLLELGKPCITLYTQV